MAKEYVLIASINNKSSRPIFVGSYEKIEKKKQLIVSALQELNDEIKKLSWFEWMHETYLDKKFDSISVTKLKECLVRRHFFGLAGEELNAVGQMINIYDFPTDIEEYIVFEEREII